MESGRRRLDDRDALERARRAPGLEPLVEAESGGRTVSGCLQWHTAGAAEWVDCASSSMRFHWHFTLAVAPPQPTSSRSARPAQQCACHSVPGLSPNAPSNSPKRDDPIIAAYPTRSTSLRRWVGQPEGVLRALPGRREGPAGVEQGKRGSEWKTSQ